MKLYVRFTAISFFILTAFSASAQTITQFKAGDRGAFLDNSITVGGLHHSYIWLYYITRFPNMHIKCFNAGIGGDNVKQMADRFDDDVMKMQPTVVTET